MIHLGLLFDFSLSPTRNLDDLLHLSGTCLAPLMAWIENRGGSGITLNVNSWLTQTWQENYQFECLERLRALFNYGITELTGTAAYHAVLPLLSAVESRRQVVLNTVQQRRLLGNYWDPGGFFPPELAYGHELVQLLPELGFRWCLSDDPFYASLQGEVPWNYVPQSGALAVLLRSRYWSELLNDPGPYDGAALEAHLRHHIANWFGGSEGYLVLAVSALSFAAPDRRSFLASFVEAVDRAPGIKLFHLSHIAHHFPRRDAEVPPGSWKTSVDDFWSGDFFAPWQSRHSPAHQKIWYLTELALQSAELLREKLDRALASKTFEQLHGGSLDSLVSLIEAALPERAEEARAVAEQIRAGQFV